MWHDIRIVEQVWVKVEGLGIFGERRLYGWCPFGQFEIGGQVFDELGQETMLLSKMNTLVKEIRIPCPLSTAFQIPSSGQGTFARKLRKNIASDTISSMPRNPGVIS